MTRLTLFRDLAVLSGGQVIAKAIGFFVFAFLARALQPKGYGAVEYATGLTLLFAAVVDSGLGVVGLRRIAHRPGDLPKLAAQIPLARFGLALLSVPLMLLVAAPATEGGARGLVWLFALSLVASAWRQDWLLQATERMSEAAFAHVVRALVFAAVVFAFVRAPASLLAVGWAEIAAVSAMSLYSLALQQATITPVRVRAPLAGFVGLVGEGAVVGLGTFLWAAMQYVPLLLVGLVAGAEQTAWFEAASRIITALLTFSNLYHFNLYPTIARSTANDKEQLARVLSASFRVVAWAGIAAALGLTLLAETVCTLAFGAKFGPSAPILTVMAWMLPTALLSGHARWSLAAAGFQSRVVASQAAGLITAATVGAPAVFLRGALGAAWAAAAAFVAVWIAAHVFARRSGAPLPSLSVALRPALLAVATVGAVQALGLEHWSRALGAVAFVALAPLADRRLLPDFARLGAARGTAAPPEPVA